MVSVDEMRKEQATKRTSCITKEEVKEIVEEAIDGKVAGRLEGLERDNKQLKERMLKLEEKQAKNQNGAGMTTKDSAGKKSIPESP